MNQAVTKFYRNLIRRNFPNSGRLKNASIFVEAIGQHMLHCGEAGNYMQLYLKVDNDLVTDAKYLCSCEPITNVAVEILCNLVKGKTLEEAADLKEESFLQIIGSRDEEICKKVQGLIELLHEGITSYAPK